MQTSKSPNIHYGSNSLWKIRQMPKKNSSVISIQWVGVTSVHPLVKKPMVMYVKNEHLTHKIE